MQKTAEFKKDIEDFIKVLKLEFNKDFWDFVDDKVINQKVYRLIEMSSLHLNICVSECNDDLNEKDLDTRDNLKICVEDEIEKIGKMFGVSFIIDTDPRGYTVALETPISKKRDGIIEDCWLVPQKEDSWRVERAISIFNHHGYFYGFGFV